MNVHTAQPKTLLQPELQALEADMRAMFSGDQTGTGLKYLYQNWHEVLADNSYYVDREDRELIEAHKHALKKTIGSGRPIVELGAGGSDKGIILAEALDASSYTSIDFWQENAQASANKSTHIPSKGFQLDFMRSSYDWRQFEAPVIVLLGSTISNLVMRSDIVSASEVLEATMLKLLEIAGPDGDVIITYDTSESAEDTYNTAEHIHFRKGLFDVLNTHVPHTFLDKGKFDAPAVWDAKNRCLSHILISQQAHTATLAGEAIPINHGQRFLEGKSYKFSKPFFEQAAKNSGSRTKLSVQARHVALAHLKPCN